MLVAETNPHDIQWGVILLHGKQANERNSCTIHTVAMVTGRCWADVSSLYKKHGRRHGCGARWSITQKVLSDLGVHCFRVAARWDDTGCLHFPCPKTIRRAVVELPQEGRFIIRSTEHLSAFVDGKHYDVGGRSLKRIREIWKVK